MKSMLPLLSLLLIAATLAAAEDPFSAFARLLPGQHHRDSTVRPITLSEIETEALENNPEIRLTQSRVASAEAQVPLASAFEDPAVMYRGWGVPVLQPWSLNQAQHMLMLSLNVPGSGKRELRYLIAAEGVDIVKLQVESKKREVIARVRLTFFDLLRTYDELRLHDDQVELARQAIAAARIKYTVGKVPQQDVLKAQIALTRLVDHLVMFERDGDLARAALNTLVGRDPSSSLEVEGSYSTLNAVPLMAELQKLAMDNRPELLAMQGFIKQSDTKTQLAGKAYKPDMTISAGYMLMPGGSPSRNAAMAELSITLPWLNRGKHDAEIQQAQSETSALRAEYRSQVSAVLQQIQQARIRAESARKLVDLYKETLRPQAQVAFRSTVAAYETDRTDFLNLLDSQNMTLDIEYAYFRALAEYEGHLAELEAAIGTALPQERKPL